MEDFIPWVRSEPNQPSTSEEEEEMTRFFIVMSPGSESGRRMLRGRMIRLKDRTNSPQMGVRRCNQS